VALNITGCLTGSWLQLLNDEFEQPYFKSLCAFLATETQAGKTIYPRTLDIFNGLNHTSFESTKVVIIGQDPYHGVSQAHGFSFSVPTGVDVPPSLKNIYKELNTDICMTVPEHGCLTSWADQGVLLLNAVLTVEHSNAGAHQGKGWEEFTDRIVQLLNDQREGIVFLLWGSYAQKKGKFIDRAKHCVIAAPHPSPLSAYRGFFGSRVFSKTNTYLLSVGQTAINWDSVLSETSAQLTMPLV
jgi:uracil-DNA glycosylase